MQIEHVYLLYLKAIELYLNSHLRILENNLNV